MFSNSDFFYNHQNMKMIFVYKLYTLDWIVLERVRLWQCLHPNKLQSYQCSRVTAQDRLDRTE